MKLMLSTFSQGDAPKILKAMRSLSYDQLVLMGEVGLEATDDFSTIQRLESLAGDHIGFEAVETSDFLEMVDRVCDILRKHRGHELCLNITGGTKLLGDAALFAAFRMGVPAYHVDDRVVRLPVIYGASAEALLTPMQREVVLGLTSSMMMDELLGATGIRSRQGLERVVRELRRMGLVTMSLRSGAVCVALSKQGLDLVKWIPEHQGKSRTNGVK